MPKQSVDVINEIIQRTIVCRPDLVSADVIQAIQSSIANLVLMNDHYYYENGTSKALPYLSGNVPTEFKGQLYHIPIEIWLQEHHPFTRPLAYVKPTPNMYISPTSPNVQLDGLILLPYLNSWDHPESDLTNLLSAMSASFSQSSPVFSKHSSSHGFISNLHASTSLPNVSTSNSNASVSIIHNPAPKNVSDNDSGKKNIHRFSDIPAELQRMLPPVQGYEELPLVSLDEAVNPLISLIPDVKQMVWIVKKNCIHPKDGLTSDESASIMLYTMEWQPNEKSFYVILNTTLRATNRDKLKPWFLYLRLVINALEKLPPYHHFIYRGVKSDLTSQYCRGNTIVWWGFSSCAVSIGTLNDENFLGKNGIRTLFNIECNSGKNIRSHSFYEDEEEVLLYPGRQFEVMGCLDQGCGLNIIHLREIQPNYPLMKFPSS